MNIAIHISKLLEFFNGFKLRFWILLQCYKAYIHRHRNWFWNCHIWWKRTLFSCEASKEPIIYIEDNFKLVFLIIEDTMRASINILNYKQSMKLFAFLCNFQKLLFSCVTSTSYRKCYRYVKKTLYKLRLKLKLDSHETDSYEKFKYF